LSDRAFESGLLFDTELMPDERELVREVVADFWRRTLYAASPGWVRWVLEEEGLTPDKLALLVQAHGARPYRRIDAPPEPVGVDLLEAELLAAWNALRERWRAEWPSLERLLLQTDALNRGTYKKESIPGWGPAIAQLLDDPLPDPCLLPAVGKLATTSIRQK